MKRLLIAAIVTLGIAAPAFAGDQLVHGYVRKDGTYVAPYHRSTPNNTTSDNYSTYGNVNPYTGEAGTRQPAPAYSAPQQSGPTARCNDGTVSYSQNHSGTCSYHGGVNQWF